MIEGWPILLDVAQHATLIILGSHAVSSKRMRQLWLALAVGGPIAHSRAVHNQLLGFLGCYVAISQLGGQVVAHRTSSAWLLLSADYWPRLLRWMRGTFFLCFQLRRNCSDENICIETLLQRRMSKQCAVKVLTKVKKWIKHFSGSKSTCAISRCRAEWSLNGAGRQSESWMHAYQKQPAWITLDNRMGKTRDNLFAIASLVNQLRHFGVVSFHDCSREKLVSRGKQ